MKIITGFLTDLWKISAQTPFWQFFKFLKQRFWHHKIKINPRLVSIHRYVMESDRMDWGLTKLGVPQDWAITRGEGVKIAVLDTGASFYHPDLKDAIQDAENFTNDEGASDFNGHGTHCLGICGARDNGIGIVGVAPMCQLYVGKVLGANGSGNFDWITQGILWAIKKQVHIISMSLGSNAPYEPIHKAIKQATDLGIIVVCAAGNDGEIIHQDTIGYPARYPETISVGSIDPNMKRSDFSSVGSELKFMAPGGEVFSCWPPDGYAVLSGTSMSTPFLSAICALILAKHLKNPGATPIKNYKDMIEHLKRITTDMHTPGCDPETGWGLIDPSKFLIID